MLILHVGKKPFRRSGDRVILAERGVRSEPAATALEAIELLGLYDYDLVVVDHDLPDLSCHELVRRMRAFGFTVPVLVVADVVAAETKIQVLDLGADDFLTGQCSLDELLARMRAIVRRHQGHAASTLRCGRVELALHSREVRVAGERLALSRREYAVLELLFLKPNVIQTKHSFLSHLYCGGEEPEIKTIDVIVCRLRKKLAAAGAPALIDTVWGSGYILREANRAEPIAAWPAAVAPAA
jgi:two-component system, cell cycle response regulator CtrA